MKIKSLILGSAAALLAVSGARAADAVMAPEPEPVDYVRVCDAYGSGFFYIPGTETCLSINGYVWFQVGASSNKSLSSVIIDPTTGAAGLLYKENADEWNYGSRVRINFDARSETELGTLRGWMRLQASWDPSAGDASAGFLDHDGNVGIDQAFIQLGGFVAGYGESAWFYQFNNSTLNYGSFSWGGLGYGYQEKAQIRYEFGGKTGLYGGIALEAPNDTSIKAYAAPVPPATVGTYTTTSVSEDSYMPDIVGRIGYGAAWGAVDLVAAYDNRRNRAWLTGPAGAGVDGNDSAFALHGEALFNIPSMPGSAFKVAAYYNSADSSYGPAAPYKGTYIYAPGAATGGTGTVLGQLGEAEWSVMASFLYQATPDLGLIVSGQYYGNHYLAGSDKTTDDVLDVSSKAYQLEFAAVWTPVKNFEVRPEITYTKMDHVKGSTSGFLRFTRYF